MALVYKITNKINGKSYVGYTVRTLDQRWKSHLSSARQGSKFRFHSALRKYGVDGWDLNIVFESDNVDECKIKETEIILSEGLIGVRGYNAKPGGCGGWIVPDEKYDEWRAKQASLNAGLNNGNAIDITNDELIKIGKTICTEYGKIVTRNVIIKECAKMGVRFPKSFRPVRFGGSYKNFVKVLEDELGMTYQPYFRSEEHREKLRKANMGKKSPMKNSRVIIDSEGNRKHVKD